MADKGTQRLEGVVKFYNLAKGWGFIKIADSERDVFVHKTTLAETGLKGLIEDDRVAFEIIDQGKGPKATNVKRLA